MIKHFEPKEVPNFDLAEEEASHALYRPRALRPECIEIRSSNIDQEERISLTIGVRCCMLKLIESAAIALKRAKEMIAWTCQEIVLLLARSRHIISVLVGFAIYQEMVARKGGVPRRTPGVPAFRQYKNWPPKICTEHSLLMGHPPCTSLTARHQKIPRT
jgi:hypothetical protein